MNNVKSEFYNLKKVDSRFTRKYSGTWYYIEISPRPSDRDFFLVISDLIRKETIEFSQNVKLLHSRSCQKKHSIPQDLKKALKRIINDLSDLKFRVLIKEPKFDIPSGTYREFHGQPLVFILDPIINFDIYPNHPHLNAFKEEVYPASVCYTDEYSRIIAMSTSQKIDFAIKQTAFWLFKHMIWVKLNEINFSDSWIGPESDRVNELARYQNINPSGLCFCGSNALFKDCCMNKIYKTYNKKDISDDIIEKLQQRWSKHNSYEMMFRKDFMEIIQELQ